MVDSGKIVFIDTPLKINDFNETMTSFKPTDQTSQVSSSNTDKREVNYFIIKNLHLGKFECRL